MTAKEMMARVDHTLLKPEATWAQIEALCDEAVQYGAASVCIQPGRVRAAVQHLAGRLPVCTVIGFPLGATSTNAKVCEAEAALADGAAEFDMVMNIGALKDGDTARVQRDIEAVRAAVPGKVLKVIIETCLLTDEEKTAMCEVVCAAGADFIKTSTGFGGAGATFGDVALLVAGCRGRCRVKAAGGIASVEDMERFIQLGADRLGTSSAVKLLQGRGAAGY